MRLGTRSVVKFDVAEEFGLLPSGRNLLDGHSNATRFYIKLRDMLRENTVIVDFSGTLSVGSSFIHEVAKQAVRDNTSHDLVIVGSDEVKEKYIRYVKEAVEMGNPLFQFNVQKPKLGNKE